MKPSRRTIARPRKASPCSRSRRAVGGSVQARLRQLGGRAAGIGVRRSDGNCSSAGHVDLHRDQLHASSHPPRRVGTPNRCQGNKPSADLSILVQRCIASAIYPIGFVLVTSLIDGRPPATARTTATPWRLEDRGVDRVDHVRGGGCDRRGSAGRVPRRGGGEPAGQPAGQLAGEPAGASAGKPAGWGWRRRSADRRDHGQRPQSGCRWVDRAVGDRGQRRNRCGAGDQGALRALGGRGDHDGRQRGRHGRAAADCGGRPRRRLGSRERAGERRHVPLRRLRGGRERRVRNREQLLGGGGRGGGSVRRAGSAARPGTARSGVARPGTARTGAVRRGPDGRGADGKRPESCRGRVLHAVGDGAQPRHTILGCRHAALLPIDRRHDLGRRYAGGCLVGGGSGRFGQRHQAGSRERAGGRRHVLLRRMRADHLRRRGRHRATTARRR